jgi:hypothetical protein
MTYEEIIELREMLTTAFPSKHDANRFLDEVAMVPARYSYWTADDRAARKEAKQQLHELYSDHYDMVEKFCYKFSNGKVGLAAREYLKGERYVKVEGGKIVNQSTGEVAPHDDFVQVGGPYGKYVSCYGLSTRLMVEWTKSELASV